MAPFNQFRPRNPYDPYDNTDQLQPSDASQIRQGAVFGQFNQPIQQQPEDNANPYIDPNQNNRDYSQPPDVASQIPDAQPSEWQGPMQGPKSNWDLLQERWKGYTPSTAASDRYNKYIDQAPVRQEPGLGRRILAGAAAFSGGPQAADEIKYGGYNEAMKDYSAKLGPYQHAAELENQQNVNERAQYGNMASTALGMDKLDETARKDRETAANNQLKAEAYQTRTEALNWKATHGTWSVEAKGDRIIAVNPTTGQRQDMGPSNAWDPYQLQNLKNAGNIEASRQAGAVAAGKQQETEEFKANQDYERSKEEDSRLRRVPPQDIDKVVQANLRQKYQTDDRVRQNGWITRDEAGHYDLVDANNIPPQNMEEFRTLVKEMYSINPPTYVRPQPPNMPKSMQGVPPTLPSKYNIPSQEPTLPESLSYDKGFFPNSQSGGSGRDNYIKDHVNQPPKYQRNSQTGEMRVSHDGGVTWRPYSAASGGR